jgi:hypothetical protein
VLRRQQRLLRSAHYLTVITEALGHVAMAGHSANKSITPPTDSLALAIDRIDATLRTWPGLFDGDGNGKPLSPATQIGQPIAILPTAEVLMRSREPDRGVVELVPRIEGFLNSLDTSNIRWVVNSFRYRGLRSDLTTLRAPDIVRSPSALGAAMSRVADALVDARDAAAGVVSNTSEPRAELLDALTTARRAVTLWWENRQHVMAGTERTLLLPWIPPDVTAGLRWLGKNLDDDGTRIASRIQDITAALTTWAAPGPHATNDHNVVQKLLSAEQPFADFISGLDHAATLISGTNPGTRNRDRGYRAVAQALDAIARAMLRLVPPDKGKPIEVSTIRPDEKMNQ